MLKCPNEKYCLICSRNECCYWNYLMGEIQCSKKSECRKLCRSKPEMKQYALSINLDEIPDFLGNKSFRKVCSKLSDSFIPEIKPYPGELEKAIKLVKKAEIGTVIISLLHFMTKTGRLNRKFFEAKKDEGLHSYLNFDGEIILATDLPNILCDKMNVDRFCIYAKSLKPDCVTTFDTYYHDDQPMFITQIKMRETLEKTAELCDEINLPVVGLAIGPSNELFEWYAKCLIELGSRILAIPCFESRSRGSKRQGLEKTAKRIQTVKNVDSRIRILLLSCSPSSPRVYGATHYSGYAAWWMVKEENKDEKRLQKLKKYKQAAASYSRQKLV